jgi:hypothetical protein
MTTPTRRRASRLARSVASESCIRPRSGTEGPNPERGEGLGPCSYNLTWREGQRLYPLHPKQEAYQVQAAAKDLPAGGPIALAGPRLRRPAGPMQNAGMGHGMASTGSELFGDRLGELHLAYHHRKTVALDAQQISNS